MKTSNLPTDLDGYPSEPIRRTPRILLIFLLSALSSSTRRSNDSLSSSMNLETVSTNAAFVASSRDRLAGRLLWRFRVEPNDNSHITAVPRKHRKRNFISSFFRNSRS